MQEQSKILRLYESLIDQVFEIEKKAEKIQEANSINRNINSLKEVFIFLSTRLKFALNLFRCPTSLAKPLLIVHH